MQKALWARGVSLLFLCLLFIDLFLSGCSYRMFLGKMDAAEQELSHGKSMSIDLGDIPLMVPPSVIARHKIAIAVDSIIDGRFNYKKLSESLTEIRNDPYVPRYLKVEAGYVLVLMERIERAGDDLESMSKKNDACERAQEQMRGELEEMKYKLDKIEEIHIDSQKRRGMQ